MIRSAGEYRVIQVEGAEARAFVPNPLPPADPPLELDAAMVELHSAAAIALAKLELAGAMVPSADWFLYGFVRKEAVITSQIEGTQATLRDVLEFETTHEAERPEDIEEVCNYVEALNYARRELKRDPTLPINAQFLCGIHERLMQGARGADKAPGRIRTTQNWIGGPSPDKAIYVPPPHEEVDGALKDFEGWIQSDDPLPPLVRAGLAHVQFESIHPFLDGNGRIGRLLVALLAEKWGLLDQPILYLSVAFKRRQTEYYEHLMAVRTRGNWERWTRFFLECVREAADDGIAAAKAIHAALRRDRDRIVSHDRATVAAIQLLDLLPTTPFITVAKASELLELTAPPARKAIELLEDLGVLHETTGKQRDRVYAYQEYLQILAEERQ